MSKSKRKHLWQTAVLALSLVMTFFLFQMPASAQTIVDTWDAVKAPPAPELKSVILDSKATALLLLDFNKQTCNAQLRPRCIASIPKVQGLLEEARSKGFTIIYSLSAGATPADIATALAPRKGEPVVTAGPDKFMGTDLEKILMNKGIKTVIVTGTAAHGAVLYTASGAAFRGMQVILPVDGMSAENTYAEQYTVWHLANAPRVSSKVTLTKIDLIK
jgi:nicotinamidase-related amidase